ncbi:MAG: Fe(3+)-hydroxamate ABC transporter permease FhuB [Gammaproteobacteria bacterium]|nr:Fe(3+)-hydroxamate ABC transporter permease FhuB [Gammaproteobacteria bacterium]
MTTSRVNGPLLLTLALGILGTASATLLLAGPLTELLQRSAPVDGYDAERLVLLHSTLPRLVMALLCGAGLGASGAILQQVLRNPIASPTTLGIDAGARLALAIAAVSMPQLVGWGRDVVALVGSAVTTLIVFAVVRQRGYTALSIVLTGLVVSLYCGALSSILVLIGDRYVQSLHIWGSGSLNQQSWEPSLDLMLRLAVLSLPIIVLLRPLSLLDADERSAATLGVPVAKLRVAAVAIAAAMAAVVTSSVGVIGFVGLVAPIIARLSGARRFGERLLFSATTGASILLLTDTLVQNVAGSSALFVPTGAITAVLASPLLLLLLPKLKTQLRPPPVFVPPRAGGRAGGYTIVAGLIAAAVVAGLALALGRGIDGTWQLASAAEWAEIWAWRVPRFAAAALAGALLGVAGVILQRVTNNEMASPEVLGVSAGAILAVACGLFVFGELGRIGMNVAAVAGSLTVLGIILLIGRRAGFAPEKVLIAGIALNALIDAVVGVMTAGGNPQAMVLLGWMSGSTGGTTGAEALQAGAAVTLLVPLAALMARWLNLLPLGGPQASALGVPVVNARLALLTLAAVLTAVATFIIGPLTFVGLMAPHVAMMMGIRQSLPLLVGAAICGASIMALADTLARTVAFPLQLPTGLTAAIVGAPFLLLLLGRRQSVTS